MIVYSSNAAALTNRSDDEFYEVGMTSCETKISGRKNVNNFAWAQNRQVFFCKNL